MSSSSKQLKIEKQALFQEPSSTNGCLVYICILQRVMYSCKDIMHRNFYPLKCSSWMNLTMLNADTQSVHSWKVHVWSFPDCTYRPIRITEPICTPSQFTPSNRLMHPIVTTEIQFTHSIHKWVADFVSLSPWSTTWDRPFSETLVTQIQDTRVFAWPALSSNNSWGSIPILRKISIDQLGLRFVKTSYIMHIAHT